MARWVYFGVVGDANRRIPYGARGRRLHKGPKRSTVDFGRRGRWRVPNIWLREEKPDPRFGRIAGEAVRLANSILRGQ